MFNNKPKKTGSWAELEDREIRFYFSGQEINGLLVGVEELGGEPFLRVRDPVEKLTSLIKISSVEAVMISPRRRRDDYDEEEDFVTGRRERKKRKKVEDDY